MCIVFSEIPFNPVLPVDQCRSFLQKSTLFGLIAHLVVLGLSGGHSWVILTYLSTKSTVPTYPSFYPWETSQQLLVLHKVGTYWRFLTYLPQLRLTGWEWYLETLA